MGHARKNQITIYPTNKCNLSCTYCFADAPSNQSATETINLNFAKLGISDYFKNNKNHQIRFYSGGEPTLAMDIIEECWNYSYYLVGDRLVSEIQTNGYFNANTLEWIAKNISTIWISIDGWPEIQNKNRPIDGDSNPAEKIINNAVFLNKVIDVGIRCTITPETVNRQIETLEYFNKLGFKRICSAPVFAPLRVTQSGNPGKINGVDIVEYITNFVSAWYAAEKMGITYMNIFMVNFDENVEYACRACLPTPHLTTDGSVSACDMGFYYNTPLKDLIYGKYDENKNKIDYFSSAIAKLRSRKCSNIKECVACSVKDICGGGCLGRAYHETRNFYGIIPEYCWATQYLAKHLPLERIKFNLLHP